MKKLLICLMFIQGAMSASLFAAASVGSCEALKRHLDLIINNKEIPEELDFIFYTETGRKLYSEHEEIIKRIKIGLSFLKRARDVLNSCSSMSEAQKFIGQALEKESKAEEKFYVIIADDQKAGVTSFSSILYNLQKGVYPFELIDGQGFLVPNNYKASLKTAIDWLIQQYPLLLSRKKDPKEYTLLLNAKKALDGGDILDAQWNLLRIIVDVIAVKGLSSEDEYKASVIIQRAISGLDPWGRGWGIYLTDPGLEYFI